MWGFGCQLISWCVSKASAERREKQIEAKKKSTHSDYVIVYPHFINYSVSQYFSCIVQLFWSNQFTTGCNPIIFTFSQVIAARVVASLFLSTSKPQYVSHWKELRRPWREPMMFFDAVEIFAICFGVIIVRINVWLAGSSIALPSVRLVITGKRERI